MYVNFSNGLGNNVAELEVFEDCAIARWFDSQGTEVGYMTIPVSLAEQLARDPVVLGPIKAFELPNDTLYKFMEFLELADTPCTPVRTINGGVMHLWSSHVVRSALSQ